MAVVCSSHFNIVSRQNLNTFCTRSNQNHLRQPDLSFAIANVQAWREDENLGNCTWAMWISKMPRLICLGA